MSTSLSRDADVRASFANDTSGLTMLPDAVARPASPEEVVEVLRQASTDRTAVTPAGGQTSTTGASITDHGILLSLRGLDRIIDIDPVRRVARAQPGVLVADLARAAAEQGLLFAPDPTSEIDATLGGAVACNASGARTLRYGPTRAHVRALKVALASGEVVEFRRTHLEKNTVGYALVHDPVDWFVGSEGTLGVVLEAEFGLLPKPERIVGLAVPFPNEPAALKFVAAARDSATVHPRCLEFFDTHTSAIFGAGGPVADDAAAPPVVYTEETLDADQEPPFDAWLALSDTYGARDADIEVFDNDAALRDARRRRHAIPAVMQEVGGRYQKDGGRRLSTDWSVPFRRLEEMVRIARDLADAAGVEQSVIFGHAGNGHPHQNFIARDPVQVERMDDVVETTLRQVLAMGGTLAAEHGIGKIKRRWVSLQLTPLQIAVMRAIKHELDPLGILSPGNVFP